MFAFLSPRLWALIGVGAALVAAFFAGVKVESNQRDAALLKAKEAYDRQLEVEHRQQRQIALLHHEGAGRGAQEEPGHFDTAATGAGESQRSAYSDPGALWVDDARHREG